MSGRKPNRQRKRPPKYARRPRAVRVHFGQELPDMLVIRTGAPCTSNRRGTVVNSGPWSNLRVNFDTIKPGGFIKALTGNKHVVRGQVIGGRVESVEPIK